MPSVRVITAVALGAALLGGCKKESNGEAPAAATPSSSKPETVVDGTVEGRTLDVKSAIFMWRDRANDMQIVLSNTAGLCDVISEEAWPKGATILYATLKHTAKDNRDDPFSAGTFPLRGDQKIEPQDTKAARFLELGPDCKPAVQAQATAGSFELKTKTVSLGGVAEGTFDLTFGADKLSGRFAAKFCAPPENEISGCR